MPETITEYLALVVRTWWARVSVPVGVVALVSELTNLVVPSWVFWLIVVVALVLAQFAAFRRVRQERDDLASQLAAADAPQVARRFTPHLLDGRLFPTIHYSVAESGERALVIRGGLAFVLDEEPEPIDTRMQQLFEDAVSGSAFEGWLQAETGVRRHVTPERCWRPVHPTNNTMVTVARDPARIYSYPFSVAGNCVLDLSPGRQPFRAGYGLLVATAIIRPDAEPTDQSPGLPLSLSDLYEALSVIAATLSDQLAPRLLVTSEGEEWHPLAYATLVTTQGGHIPTYVGLDHYGWSRAEGSYEPSGFDGRASSEEALRDPAQRETEIKGWVARFLRDAGYSDFENDVERLQLPRLPMPIGA